MAKIIKEFLENLIEYCFLNIIVNVNPFSDLNLNITVSTTLKYCYKKTLNNKLNLIGGAMKYFSKKLLKHEIFRSMVSWTMKFFFEKFENTPPPAAPPTYLIHAPLV